ncbi:MAG: glutamine--fructose-6-phosphate transaminase (isomerizing), partial [Treponema sp.]|nr:glutamine--fructose-6-phosphate transaminase (isomerizing) [Treponema sp.]
DQKQLAVLYADHVDLFDGNGNRVIKSPYHVDWDLSSAEKNGWEHFMLKEIHEQPKALTDTMRPRFVKGDDGKIRDIKFEEIKEGGEDFWKNARRIVITACGTAYHAGVVAKYAFEKFARIPVVVDVASEFRYRDPILNKDDVFIVISQSGETADTLAALRLAKSSGVHVIAITNCVGSTVSREADDIVYTWAGPEIAVASTKAYTTQLACLYMLALKAAHVKGTITGEEYGRLLEELAGIPDKVQKILDDKAVIQKFVSRHFNKDKVFFIGRQFDSATSLECALKLKEVSYMHSEAFAAGELKHGPIALMDPATLVVATATQQEMYEKLASNIVEVKTRGAATLVITQDRKGAFKEAADEVFTIPECESAFASILSIVPSQLFAYYCAVHRGIDPDKPRNLAKSVTVE